MSETLSWIWIPILISYLLLRGWFRLHKVAVILTYGLLRFIWFRLIIILLALVRLAFRQGQRISLPEPQPTPSKVSELVHRYNLKQPTEVILGFRHQVGHGQIKIDVGREHTLIGGTTNAGKTYLIHNILIQLFGKGALFREAWDVYLVDLKGSPGDHLAAWRPLCAGFVQVGPDQDMGPALRLLTEVRSHIHRRSERRTLLIVDEVAALTYYHNDPEVRAAGGRILGSLANQFRTAGSMILATQYPIYEVVKTLMRYNLNRRICLRVPERKQAGIVLGVNPTEEQLPLDQGQFLLVDPFLKHMPGASGLYTGRSMLADIPGEIEKIVFGQVEDFAAEDWRLELCRQATEGKRQGDKAVAINSLKGPFGKYMKREHPELPLTNMQDRIMFGYRNFAEAGAFVAPQARGQSYLLAVDQAEALGLVRNYIAAGSWQEAPETVV